MLPKVPLPNREDLHPDDHSVLGSLDPSINSVPVVVHDVVMRIVPGLSSSVMNEQGQRKATAHHRQERCRPGHASSIISFMPHRVRLCVCVLNCTSRSVTKFHQIPPRRSGPATITANMCKQAL